MTNDGWRCPGCGRCYALWVAECRYCGQPGATSGGYAQRQFDTRCGRCGNRMHTEPNTACKGSSIQYSFTRL